MLNDEKEKEMQINQILSLVKLASLSFPAIAFLQYFPNYFDHSIYFLNYGYLIIAVLSVILIIYSLWTLLQSKVSAFAKKLIDATVSFSIALLSVMLTGSYESSYKFLFIFVIISSSIECSMRASISIAGLTAAIILGIDLAFAPKTPVNMYFESDIVLACAFLIIAWTIAYYVDLRKKHIEGLRDMVNIDGLTGLFNHRYFYDYLEKQTEISKKYSTPLSLLFIDIDNFKYYNDLYGHPKGDEVLRSIAEIMKKTVKREAFIARYGGEEFTVLFPNTDEALAIKEAEGLRKAVHEHHFNGQENLPGGSLTISVGVSTFPTKAKSDAELLKRADEACYRAKFLYKNRVEAYRSILDELQGDVYGLGTETITSIKTLIAVINAKDKYTYGHVERVAFYCNMMADKLRLNASDRNTLIFCAYLHDIGKINIPEDILMKSESLTDEEWEILKDHPQRAVQIIENISSLQYMSQIILQHHERCDGNGYPNGLKGEEILYLARVLTVADSFDAMTSIRPYQHKKTYHQAVAELLKCSGTQFDPEIVNSFISAVEESKKAIPVGASNL